MRCCAAFIAAVCMVLASGAGVVWAQDAPVPSARIRAILQRPAFGFCHDPPRVPEPGDLRYCGYIDAKSACPEYARACERWLAEPARAKGWTAVSQASSALRHGVRWIFLTVLLGGLAVLVVVAVRALAKAGGAEPRDPSKTVSSGSEPLQKISVWTEAPLEILGHALEARRRREYDTALYTLYQALLRKLDQCGAIRMDPASTSGDYVRQCTVSEVRSVLREAAHEVERVRFGGAVASGEAFDRLTVRIESIVRGFTAVVLVLFLTTGPLACSNRSGSSGLDEAGPGGHQAVRELLRAEGLRTAVLLGTVDSVKDVDRVIVIDGEDFVPSGEQWQKVFSWVEQGGALVVAGGADQWPARIGVDVQQGESGAWVTLGPSLGAKRVRVSPGMPELLAQGYTVAEFDADGGVYGTWMVRGKGRVLVLAGSELLTNGGIAVGDNATASAALFRAFAQGREVDFLQSEPQSPDDPVGALARAGLLPAIVQGLLAIGIFYLAIGRPFGTLRDRTPASRRQFSEHVAAVGGLYARARHSRAVLRAYGTMVLERLREQSIATGADPCETIAARLGEPRDRVEQVMRAIERAKQGDAFVEANETEDLRTVKCLNEWLRKIS